MKRHFKRHLQGFTILEALIALIVVAVGAAGIAMLNTMLLQGTGESKARSEAIQVAQDQLEVARDYSLATGCSSLNNITVTEQGTNANFNISALFSSADAGDPWRNVQVCVTWNDGTCAGNTDRVILNSVVACEGMGTSALVGEGGGTGGGGFLKTPSGRGEVVGGEDYDGTRPVGAEPGPISDDNSTPLTYTHLTADGVRELLDPAGNVLLRVRPNTCDPDEEAPDFSTISGRIFVEAKKGSPLGGDDLFVLPSDASVCVRQEFNSSRVYPENTTGNAIEYFYSDYICYFGAEWWGNIGMVRTGSTNTNELTCVGNPNSTQVTDSIFSKHSQRSTARSYRGYRDLGNDIFETRGIGETNDKVTDAENNVCKVSGRDVYKYIPHHYKQHHFLHATITGKNTCKTEGEALHVAAGNTLLLGGPLNPDSGPGTVTVVNENDAATALTMSRTLQALNNPGRFYCMSADDYDGVSCLSLTSPDAQRSTWIRGVITIDDVGSPGLSIIDPNDSVCAEKEWNPVKDGDSQLVQYEYGCKISWEGWSGDSWFGAIAFAPVNETTTLCAPDPLVYSAEPPGFGIAFTVNDANAASNANSLYFTDIPNAVAQVDINFDIKEGSCGRLGQPQVSCEIDKNVATFAWDPILGADTYKVRTCLVPNASNTPCDPINGESINSLGKSETLANSKMTFCMDVTASSAAGSLPDSVTSSRKCATRSGQSSCMQ
jgi:Tfp pilus assembly protein PilV